MAATILIVDDEEQLLRLMVRVFEREGFEVLAAEDGDQALALFDAHAERIDAMVLDVIIPPEGAAPVLERVLERRPGLKVVLASGDQLEDELRDLLQDNGGRFLRKPFLPKALLKNVRELSGVSAPAQGG